MTIRISKEALSHFRGRTLDSQVDLIGTYARLGYIRQARKLLRELSLGELPMLLVNGSEVVRELGQKRLKKLAKRGGVRIRRGTMN